MKSLAHATRPVAHVAAGILSVLSFVDSVPAQEPAEFTWEYFADKDIQHLTLTPFGNLLFTTKEQSAVLDPSSGSPLWTSNTLRDCKEQESDNPGGSRAARLAELLTRPPGLWGHVGADEQEVNCKFGDIGKGTLRFDLASGMALFEYDMGLSMIDLDTGDDWLWVVPDRDAVVDAYPHQATMLVAVTPKDERDGRVATLTALEKRTGHQLWSAKLPFVKGIRTGWTCCGWGPHKRRFREGVVLLRRTGDTLLLAGEDTNGRVGIASVSANSGELQWIQTDVPQFIEKPRGDLGPVKPGNFLYAADTYIVDDSTLVVVSHVQAAGGEPFAVDLETGEVQWKTTGISYESNQLCESCSLLEGDALYVTQRQRTAAIAVADGSTMWNERSEAGTSLRMVDQGLLVGCSGDPCFSVVELRDPNSGQMKWPNALRLEKGKSPSLLEDAVATIDEATGRIMIAVDERLQSVDIETGVREEVAELDFQFKEPPTGILNLRDLTVVLSKKNTAAYRSDGSLAYSLAYQAPKQALWSSVASTTAALAFSVTALGQYSYLDGEMFEQYAKTQQAQQYHYVYTSDPDSKGMSGYSLVQLRYSDGREVARAWVNQRKPDFVLDPGVPAVYARYDGRRIVAIPFVPHDFVE